jgi:hypothetical protein
VSRENNSFVNLLQFTALEKLSSFTASENFDV